MMPDVSATRTTVIAPDGIRIAVHLAGDAAGPTVVALHGYPDDHAVWDGVVAELVADHRVVTYDVRGAGASDVPRVRAGYHLDRLADDLLAVLDAAAPGRAVHLLAHDWGSVAAWHAVTGDRLTGRVASFTSISGPGLDHVAAWFRRRRSRAAVARQLRASWYTAFFRLPVLPELGWRCGLMGRVVARREGIPRPAVRDAVHGLELYRANLAGAPPAPPRRTDVPVQVLAPTGDRFITAALQTEIDACASDLRVHRIPGGHWLPRHRPDVVAGHVRELVARVEGGRLQP